MAIGISSTGSSILGFELTITDANEGDRFAVTRTDNDGFYETVYVRGADFATPDGATMVVTDYEAPFNADITYEVSSYDISDLETPLNTDDVSETTNTEVPVGFAMIHQVFDVAERVTGTVTKEGLTSWNREANILSENKVLGRPFPVVITDKMGPRTGSIEIMNLLTHTTDYDDTDVRVYRTTELAKWRTIFDDGATMMFRSSVRNTGFFDIFFKAKSVATDRSSGGVQYFHIDDEWPLLVYTINYQEVERPLTSSVGLGLTGWEDVYNNNADWNEVLADHADWLSVLQNPTL